MSFPHDSVVQPLFLLNPSMEKQVLELLRSHTQPPAHLAATMSTVAAGLAQYDTELARLRAQSNRVMARRAALQDHYDRYASLLAPIRRLPSEILVKIFDLCRRLGDHFLTFLRRTTHPLEQAPLLIVAQVCSRWRSIALDTHTLWDAIELTGREPVDKVMGLLRVALQRGGNCMINVTVSGSPPPEALKLLARRSERWLTFRFCCASSDLQYLSAAKGHLPLLRTVELDPCSNWQTLPTLNLFKVAPKLRYLTVDGDSLPTLGKTPVEQLHSLTFRGLDSTHFVAAISLMSRLSRNTKCNFSFVPNGWDKSLDSDSETTSSDIIALSLEFDFRLSAVGVGALRDILAMLLSCFTFPGLHELSVGTSSIFRHPLTWPCDHFLALSERSSFDAHLTSLQLHRVLITEEELLQCLAALPSLEQLAISDHRRDREEEHEIYGEYVDDWDDGRHDGADCDLITDTLLAELTRAQDSPCLVPRLRVFDIHSVLKFDDYVCLAFLQSRVAAETPFESHIRWMFDDHRHRALHWQVVREIDELCRRKELVFSFEMRKG